MARTMPLSEAKAHLSELVAHVEQTDDELVITRNGVPAAVLISAEEFESLQEMREIRRDPTLLAEIRDGLADLEAGKGVSFEEVFGEPLRARRRRR